MAEAYASMFAYARELFFDHATGLSLTCGGIVQGLASKAWPPRLGHQDLAPKRSKLQTNRRSGVWSAAV
jgi:hypothetical protein